MRVIAGMARGRPLKSIESRLVRPTGDKIKGAIFSMLEAEAFKRGLVEPGYLSGIGDGDLAFPWRTVLDLYAGSGALGIEALSRGAGSVDFVEADPRAREAIVENLRGTGLASRARVHGMKAEAAISTFSHPYDLILMDPPYDDPAVDSVLSRLCDSRLVGASTFLVYEHARQRTVPPRCGPLGLLKTRVHGRTGTKDLLFSAQERVEMAREAVGAIANVEVESFSGLTVEYAKMKGACALVRGLRAISDFEFELEIAHMNRNLNPNLEAVFLMSSLPYTYLRSSIVKEIAQLGGSLDSLVPEHVEAALRRKYEGRLPSGPPVSSPVP